MIHYRKNHDLVAILITYHYGSNNVARYISYNKFHERMLLINTKRIVCRTIKQSDVYNDANI